MSGPYDAEQIAAAVRRLTKPLRQWVLNDRRDCWDVPPSSEGSNEGSGCYYLVSLGIADFDAINPEGVNGLTPLGLAVRKHLEARNDEG